MAFDLKPLTKELIHERELNTHDLWIVKWTEEIHGPFETEEFKNYVAQHEDDFDEAFATRMDTNDWQPVFSHAQFQRRSPQIVKKETSEGPFWYIDHGLKLGPISSRDLEKRIEMGSIRATDLISVNDGYTWMKLFELEGFDRRTLHASELPQAPLDSAFQRAKIEVLEKLENGDHDDGVEDLAESVHHYKQEAKVIAFRPEEMGFKSSPSITVSSELAPALMKALGIFVFVGGVGFYLFENLTTPEMPMQLAMSDEEAKTIVKPRPKLVSKRGVTSLQPATVSRREPASNAPSYPASPGYSYTEESQFPTYVESHYNDPEPMNESADEPTPPPSQENSLVGALPEENPEVEANLEAQNASPESQPEQPVVEEVSDF